MMNKSKILLVLTVVIVSLFMTIITMYIYGAWQHDRYWNGTIVRVNMAESQVCSNLLSTDISSIYIKKDYDKLKGILKPLNGKLLVRLTDEKGNIIFDNLYKNRKLGPILQQSQVEAGMEIITIQIISYLPPSWDSEYFNWFSHFSEWFSIKYDYITVPMIFYFLIWVLFLTAIIWRYKAHLENDRLFHVLNEFAMGKNEKKLE